MLADLGKQAEVEALFVEAQYHHRDVSPFPVVSLYFQQSLMWQRVGRLSRARALLEAACDRLPGYAQATAHLAAREATTGAREQAIARLRSLIKGSDDPEYVGQLAALLKEARQTQEAEKLRAQA